MEDERKAENREGIGLRVWMDGYGLWMVETSNNCFLKYKKVYGMSLLPPLPIFTQPLKILILIPFFILFITFVLEKKNKKNKGKIYHMCRPSHP